MPIKSGRPWVVRTVVGTARQVREQDARASHAARPAPGPSGDRKDARSDWLTGLQSIRVLGSGGSGLRLHSDVVESVPLRSTLRAEPTQVLGYRYRKVLPQTCAEYSAYGLRTASRRPALVVSTLFPQRKCLVTLLPPHRRRLERASTRQAVSDACSGFWRSHQRRT